MNTMKKFITLANLFLLIGTMNGFGQDTISIYTEDFEKFPVHTFTLNTAETGTPAQAMTSKINNYWIVNNHYIVDYSRSSEGDKLKLTVKCSDNSSGTTSWTWANTPDQINIKNANPKHTNINSYYMHSTCKMVGDSGTNQPAATGSTVIVDYSTKKCDLSQFLSEDSIFTKMTSDVSTLGKPNVHLNLWYAVGGPIGTSDPSVTLFGQIFYSIDGGNKWIRCTKPKSKYTQSTLPNTANECSWDNLDITELAFENQPKLRFGFKFTNRIFTTSKGGYEPAYSLDDINIYNINPPTSVDFIADKTTICEGETVKFTDITTPATSVTEWSWTFNGGTPTTSTIKDPSVVYNTPGGPYDVTLTTTGVAGTKTKTQYITVNKKEAAVNAGADATITCAPTSIGEQQDGPCTYLWASAPNDNTFNKTISNPSVQPTINTTYTVTKTCPCGITTDDVMVTLGAKPTISITASPSTPVCEGESVTLTASTADAGTYVWTGGNSGQNTIIVKPDPPNTGYSVTATSCGSFPTATINIKVNPNPKPAVTFNPSICIGNSIVIQLDSPDPTWTYNWTGPGTINTNTSKNPEVTPTSQGANDYIATVTDVNGCEGTAKVTVTGTNTPTADITPKSTAMCLGETLELTASGGDATLPDGYVWDAQVGIIGTDLKKRKITVKPDAAGIYPYTVHTNSSCGSADASETVTIRPLPVVDAGIDQNVIQKTDFCLDTASVNRDSLVTGYAASPFKYEWTPNFYFIDDINTIIDPCGIPLDTGTTKYFLKVTDKYGCVSSDSLLLIVQLCEGDVFVPNIFSPNGDIANDKLKIGLRDECIKEVEIHIYNRWGEEVFKSIYIPTESKEQKENKWWDGKHKNRDCPPSVFAYHIIVTKIGGGKEFRKGTVTLVR